jgi:hypothetical protein
MYVYDEFLYLISTRHKFAGLDYRLIQSGIIKWRTGKIFKNFFNYKVSREEHKTIYNGLRILGMAVLNQSDSPTFFSPWKVKLKIGLIPEDDLLRLAKAQLTKS